MIRAHVLCCGGTGCTSSGSQKIQDAFVREIEKQGLAEEVKVVQTGCFGLCALGPVVILYPDGTFYSRVEEKDVAEIVSEHLLKGRPVERLVYNEKDETTGATTESLNDTTFYKSQYRLALRPRDSNGAELFDGDAVTVIKDLKVKGSSMVIKRGTKVKSIRLTDDPEHVDCKIEGSSIVLKTCFLKK